MNLFTPEGWLNIEGIERACPLANFFVLIGTRQVGKTYGVLDYFHEKKYKYVFMRLTQEEMKYTCTAKLNMYKEKNFPWASHMTIAQGKPTFIYDDEYKEGKEPVAMALALSDVAKVRGFGAALYTHIIFDEFIPEVTAYQREGQGFAFKNAYVTINSNRDTPIGGNRPAVKCWMLANSNDLTSDILAEMHWTSHILSMQKRGQSFKYLPQLGVCFVMVNSNSPVSQQMQQSAIFKAMGDNQDDFSKMALENVFINDDATGVCSRPLQEYAPMCNIDDLTLYRHKARNEWYIVERGEKTKVQYQSKNATSYKAFLSAWKWQGILNPVDGSSIFYNSYTAKIKAYKLLRIDK